MAHHYIVSVFKKESTDALLEVTTDRLFTIKNKAIYYEFWSICSTWQMFKNDAGLENIVGRLCWFYRMFRASSFVCVLCHASFYMHIVHRSTYYVMRNLAEG